MRERFNAKFAEPEHLRLGAELLGAAVVRARVFGLVAASTSRPGVEPPRSCCA